MRGPTTACPAARAAARADDRAAVPRELLLMLLADARLPVAGHTQSGGLEPAVRAGLSAAGVPAYLTARLDTVVAVEAGTAVVARHRLLAGRPLEPVVAAWAARTPAPALRAAARTQGRALARLAGRLWPGSPHLAALGTLDRPAPRAVVLGAVAAAAGLDACGLALLVAYDDLQTVAASALKLLPLDPAEATCWVHGALPAAVDLAAAYAGLTDPTDIPARSAPQTDLWAQLHDQTTRRLFRA